MRVLWFALAVTIGMAACAPTPYSGFPSRDNSSVYTGSDTEFAAAPLGSDPLSDDPARKDDASAIAAQALAALDAGETGDVEALPTEESFPAISDENSFDAVAARETIESDAERIQRNAENYQVIEATPLPARIGETGPNIVAYALSATNPLGNSIYKRLTLASEFRYKRACANFTSPDMAQTTFLARGGPKTDWLGIDPDGDGYACDWDPTPFREAAGL